VQLELSLVQCFSPYPSTVTKLGIKIARIKTDRGAEVFEQEVWSQYEVEVQIQIALNWVRARQCCVYVNTQFGLRAFVSYWQYRFC
jgi:hypothetical protein